MTKGVKMGSPWTEAMDGSLIRFRGALRCYLALNALQNYRAPVIRIVHLRAAAFLAGSIASVEWIGEKPADVRSRRT